MTRTNSNTSKNHIQGGSEAQIPSSSPPLTKRVANCKNNPSPSRNNIQRGLAAHIQSPPSYSPSKKRSNNSNTPTNSTTSKNGLPGLSPFRSNNIQGGSAAQIKSSPSYSPSKKRSNNSNTPTNSTTSKNGLPGLSPFRSNNIQGGSAAQIQSSPSDSPPKKKSNNTYTPSPNSKKGKSKSLFAPTSSVLDNMPFHFPLESHAEDNNSENISLSKDQKKKKNQNARTKKSRDKQKALKEALKSTSSSTYYISTLHERTSEEIANYIKSLDSTNMILKTQIEELQRQIDNLTKLIDKGNVSFAKPVSTTPWKDQTKNKIIFPLEDTPIIKKTLFDKFQMVVEDSSIANKDVIKVIYVVTSILKEMATNKEDIAGRYSKNKFKIILKEFVEVLMNSIYMGYLGAEIKDDIVDYFRESMYNASNISATLDSQQGGSLNYSGFNLLRRISCSGDYQRNTLMECTSSVQRYDRSVASGAKIILNLCDRVEEALCSIDIMPTIKHLIIASGEFNKSHGFIDENDDNDKPHIVYTYTLDGALLTQLKAFTITALGIKDPNYLKSLSCEPKGPSKLKYEEAIDDEEIILATDDQQNFKSKYHSPFNYVLHSFMSRNDTDKNSFKFGTEFSDYSRDTIRKRPKKQTKNVQKKKVTAKAKKGKKGKKVDDQDSDCSKSKSSNIDSEAEDVVGDPTKELTKDEIVSFVKKKEQEFTQLSYSDFEGASNQTYLFHLAIRRHHPIYHSESYKASLKEKYDKTKESEKDKKDLLEIDVNRELLRFLIEKGNLVGYCSQFKDPLSMIKDPQSCCICLMHCIMRVSEKLITLLLRESCKEHTNKNFSQFVKPNVQAVINGRLSNSTDFVKSKADPENNKTRCQVFFEMLSENEDKSEDYDFQIKESKNSVDGFKISYTRMLKLLEVTDLIIEASDLEKEKEEQYMKIFNSWNSIIVGCFKDGDYSTDDIDSLWSNIVEFRELFLTQFGGNNVTNYIHILISGHLIEMIKSFGNIAIFSGIGFESLIGRIRSYIHRRTNHAGSNGGNKKSTHSSNVINFIYRRFARQLHSLSNDNKDSKFKDLYDIENMKSTGASAMAIKTREYNKEYKQDHKEKIKIERKHKALLEHKIKGDLKQKLSKLYLETQLKSIKSK